MDVIAEPDTAITASGLHHLIGATEADSPVSILKPWEQHGGVINMPRYLYSPHAAPLLRRSGFLITCAFQREKSATKEAMEILHEFLGVLKPGDGADSEPDAKRARIETYSDSTEQKSSDFQKVDAEPLSQERREIRGGEVGQLVRSDFRGKLDGASTEEGPFDDASRDGLVVGNSESVSGSDRGTVSNCSPAAVTKQQFFSLVKLARNGMVYISIPSRSPGDLVTFFAKIMKDFHTRSRAAPRWCHRIFPVQATCLWTKEDVQSNVLILVKEFIKRRDISSNSPLKYAIAVKRRGLEEKEETGGAASTTGTFGKHDCIDVVAEAIQSLMPHISVDLTNPQMVVILELLPLVRVESSVCAVSVLPRELVVTKPKLVIQALAPPKKQR